MNNSGHNNSLPKSPNSISIKNIYNKAGSPNASKAITPKNQMQGPETQKNFNTINVSGSKNIPNGMNANK